MRSEDNLGMASISLHRNIFHGYFFRINAHKKDILSIKNLILKH